MADAATNYVEGLVLDAMLNGVSFTPPSAVYVALFETATDDSGGGSEISGGSYIRQAASFTSPTQVDGMAQCENVDELSFTDMPAATVTHAAVFDAESAGNMLYHGALATQREVQAGDTFKFDPGEFKVRMD